MGDTITIEKITRQLTRRQVSTSAHTNGSARDYFLAMSQGLFDPTFEVVAKVKVSRGYAYYGKNGNGRNDVHVLDLVKEACDLAAEQGVDFRKYVEADKGCVPLVSIMYAGPGEANSTDEHADDYILAAPMDRHRLYVLRLHHRQSRRESGRIFCRQWIERIQKRRR